jgi:predicted RecB family nuclease
MDLMCPRGHRFSKSSDCRTCPKCEAERLRNPEFPPGVSNPARRALEGAGVTTLADLTQHRRSDLLALHGMGPKAMRALDEALAERGLAYAP